MRKKAISIALFKCLTVAVIAGSTLSITAQSKKDRDRSKALVTEADKAYTAKNYREAADKYEQATVLVPTNPDVHYRKGFAFFNLKENQKAIEALTTALSQGYKPLEIYRLRHYINFQDKNFDAALADVDKGLALVPNDVSFLTARGEILMEKKDHAGALQVFEKVLKTAPNSADVHYNIARIHFAMGNPAGQATAAQAALLSGTKFPGDAFFLLGDANQKQRNAPQAIDAYQKSIKVKPDFYQTYRNLADVQMAENRLNDAIATLKEGLKAFPTDGGFYTELSWLYSLADRPADAVQAARAGISILPNESLAYTNLCRAYNETKSYDLAIGACNQALRLKPGDGETHFYLGRALNLTGKAAEATKQYRLAVTGLEERTAKNANAPDGWYLLGNAYFADNQRDKAIEAYLKGLELSPKFTKARYNLGIIYTLKKNKPAASSQYDVLLSLDPKLAASLKAEIDKI
jgi:tetratricopeptide (TPR) repeat protein